MNEVPSFHQALRFVHIALGAIGLLAFWVPVFAPKGRPLHVFCGRLFVGCAYPVAATALISCGWAIVDPASFLGTSVLASDAQQVHADVRFFMAILGVLAIWVLTGLEMGMGVLRTRRAPQRLASRRVIGVQVAATFASAALALFGGWRLAIDPGNSRYWIPLALGLFGLADSVKAFRFIHQPRPTPMAWWYAHMENMLGCGIAFHTAFLVFGANWLLGWRPSGALALVPWLLPTVIGVPAIAIWVGYYRRKFGEAAPRQASTREKQEG